MIKPFNYEVVLDKHNTGIKIIDYDAPFKNTEISIVNIIEKINEIVNYINDHEEKD